MKVVIQPEISVELENVEVLAVRDVFSEKKIIARIFGLPRPVILWGPLEYDSKEARLWTNESVRERAIDLLSKDHVPFE